ncbi:MAG: N-6 DNA methylase [Armatimonadota bacterium]|nr:N-6 DNA methylase [Armatimonadota bacterium]
MRSKSPTTLYRPANSSGSGPDGRNHTHELRSLEKQFVPQVLAAAEELCGGLVNGREETLDAYNRARIVIIRLIVLLFADARGLLPEESSQALRQLGAEGSDAWRLLDVCISRLAAGMSPANAPDLFDDALAPGLEDFHPADDSLVRAMRILADTTPDFGLLPVSLIGRAYEALQDAQPCWEDGRIVYGSARAVRKASGQFFTAPALIDYIVRNTLAPIAQELAFGTADEQLPDRLLSIRVLDPACGCGDFLVAAAEFIGNLIASRTGSPPAPWALLAARRCVCGVDSDPVAVAIAKVCLWLKAGAREEGYWAPEGLRHGDSLLGDVEMPPESGFDAVIGNPPYVARKNEDIRDYQLLHDCPGQSDYYLLFLAAVIRRGLVREGGYLSMVLPDPFLVRGNAADVRRTLVGQWTMKSLLHIVGMFPGAGVANVVPVCRNLKTAGYSISVRRVDSRAALGRFANDCSDFSEHYPVSSRLVLSQPGCEVLYLANERSANNVYVNVHGRNGSVNVRKRHYVPLGETGVEIFRGEEIGKRAIASEVGDLPALLGGQSIGPFHIRWEGRRMDRSAVRKPLERYLCEKLVVQKSSDRLIAALDTPGQDHPGFIVPQSVYCIRPLPNGPNVYYLLALLNSAVLNDYARRAFTGYKLVQPQIEVEDLKRLPIRRIAFNEPTETREQLVSAVLQPAGDKPSEALAAAACWLEQGKECLVHDLAAALARELTQSAPSKDLPAFQRRTFVLNLLNELVRLLYGLNGPSNSGALSAAL